MRPKEAMLSVPEPQRHRDLRGSQGSLGILVGITGVVGITVGLIALGKYSQLSVVFYFPFFYILLLSFLSMVFQFFPKDGQNKNQHKRFYRVYPLFLSLLLIIISLFGSLTEVNNVVKREKGEFEEYITRLRSAIPAGSKVLMNLNGDSWTSRSIDRGYNRSRRSTIGGRLCSTAIHHGSNELLPGSGARRRFSYVRLAQ